MWRGLPRSFPSSDEYERYGHHTVPTLLRQFGSWAESLSATALPETGTEVDLSLDEIGVLEALVEAELGEKYADDELTAI